MIVLTSSEPKASQSGAGMGLAGVLPQKKEWDNVTVTVRDFVRFIYYVERGSFELLDVSD